MADVFKILLEGKKNKKRQNNEQLKELFNQKEAELYTKDNSEIKIDSTEDENDILLGNEGSDNNYISDIEKISLRDLDKKNPKEQLKILKLEYNRLFDRIEHLNDLVVARDKNINDLMIEKRENEQRIKTFRSIIRSFINVLPGNAELKRIVSQGNWTRDQIIPHLEQALTEMLDRDKQLEVEINTRLDDVKKENFELKNELNQYKIIAMKVLELENKLKRKEQEGLKDTDSARTKENNEGINTDPSLPEKENITASSPAVNEIKQQKTEEQSKNKKIDSEKTGTKSEHSAHFSSFFEEFENSYEEIKKENANNSKPTITEEKKNNINDKEKDIRSQKSTGTPFTNNDNHPLSPDYVESEKQEVSELFDGNIQSYLKNISEDQEFLIKVIGETGISRNPDLRDYLNKNPEGKKIYTKGRSFDYQRMSNDIAELRGKDILSEEKTASGNRAGGNNIIIYELSEIGKQCFKKLFKDNPVIPEKKRIKDLHGSYEHGYMIKDSANIFKELGYEVLTKNEDCTVPTKDGRKKVFDFIIIDENGGKKYIEVERGTHNKQDFFEAMDKIHQITKEFYFITPNREIKLKKTKQMFFNWITENLGGIQNAGVVLNLTTITELRKKPKKIWETTDLRELKK